MSSSRIFESKSFQSRTDKVNKKVTALKNRLK